MKTFYSIPTSIMENPVLIFGAGDLGMQALDIFRRNNVLVYGFLDDHAEFDRMFRRARLAPAGGKHIGSVAIHPAILETLDPNPRDDAPAKSP